MPDYSLEQLHGAPEQIVAGLDEVGRGPLAGPVVAAALVFLHPPTEALAALIDDSKRLTALRRQRAYQELRHTPYVRIGVGAASVTEIGLLTIGRACHLAMQRAMQRLTLRPQVALVDGCLVPDLPCITHAVVGGDRKSLSIAAASIVAKVTRDRLMARLAVRYASYGWEKNAGYGTVAHVEGLRRAGVTVHHRRGFAPIRALLAREASFSALQATASRAEIEATAL